MRSSGSEKVSIKHLFISWCTTAVLHDHTRMSICKKKPIILPSVEEVIKKPHFILFAAVVEEVDEMKEKFEGEFGRSHAKLADYWPNAFRWTCCGMRLDEGNWGCDHHGDPRSPVPCKCDFCRAGKPVPERIHKKRAENGLQLRRGPDLRSGSAAGSMNFALRQMFMGSD